MKRKIVHIAEDQCTGCGACAKACHEGAIAMVNGRAKLIRDDYCDGLGDCLPVCPAGAISILERDAAPYDEVAVREKKETLGLGRGCPGTEARAIERSGSAVPCGEQTSQLSQWPVQIKLLPVNAPYFDGAKLLIAADCTAYAYAGFHDQFIRGHITMVGCPKLDNVDYSEKLTDIIRSNEIREITIVRMEVPCCGGLENAVKAALRESGKSIPCQVVTISTDGKILK